MKKGDLVRCKELMLRADPEREVGVIIEIDEWQEDGKTGTRICVAWPEDWYWYHRSELEVIFES